MIRSAVILCSNPTPSHYWVGGLPLLARQLKELHKLGVRECHLLGHDQVPLDILAHRVPADLVVRALPSTAEKWPQLVQTLMQPNQDILLLQGDWLIDPRLLSTLLTSPTPQRLMSPDPSSTDLPVAARASGQNIDLWAASGPEAWRQSTPTLDPDTLETYQPSHRGHKPFYLKPITSSDSAREGTQTVVEAAQKRALDLPALLVHPLFENQIVRWLCNTPITPNHVTLFTAFLGAIIAALFLNGWLRLAIPLAYVVAILDGVDGKLARTKLQTSKLGEVEHVLDFFVEHAWYLTLTLFFVSHTESATAWWIGGGLMAGDLLDKLLYMTGHLTLGKQIDEMGTFDRQFRLIGGRRNIYLWIFLVGFWSGVPFQAFTIACIWALCTAAIHSVRLVYHLSQRQIATA